jgi:hypothetical protein
MRTALIPGFSVLIQGLFQRLLTKLSTFFGKPVCLHSRNVQNRYVLEYKEVVGKLSSTCPKLVSLFSSSLPTSLSTGCGHKKTAPHGAVVETQGSFTS